MPHQINEAVIRVVTHAITNGIPDIHRATDFLEWVRRHGLETIWDGTGVSSAKPSGPAATDGDKPVFQIGINRKGNATTDLFGADLSDDGGGVTAGDEKFNVVSFKVPVPVQWKEGAATEYGDAYGKVPTADGTEPSWFVQIHRTGLFTTIPHGVLCEQCKKDVLSRWEIDHGDKSEEQRQADIKAAGEQAS